VSGTVAEAVLSVVIQPVVVVESCYIPAWRVTYGGAEGDGSPCERVVLQDVQSCADWVSVLLSVSVAVCPCQSVVVVGRIHYVVRRPVVPSRYPEQSTGA